MMNCYLQNAILPTIFCLKKIDISGFINASALIKRSIALKFIHSFSYIILYLFCREFIFAGRVVYLQLRRAFVRLKSVPTLACPNFSLLSRHLKASVPAVPKVSPRSSAYIRKFPKVNPLSSSGFRSVPKVSPLSSLRFRSVPKDGTRAAARFRELLKACRPSPAEKREEILLTNPLIT